jgi:hypothetical protein
MNTAQNLELFPQLCSFIVLLLQEALLVRYMLGTGGVQGGKLGRQPLNDALHFQLEGYLTPG